MKSAVLTIDDIASKNTPAIVDYLVKNNIEALMFAVGMNVEKYYDEAIYALKAGMIVGNHSYSHPAFSKITLEEGIAEIEKNEEVLNKLYKDAGVIRKYRPFRFPYGDKGGENMEGLQKYFKEKGFNKLVDSQITYPWWAEGGNDKYIDTFWTFDFCEYRVRPDSGFTEADVMERLYNLNPVNGGALLKEGARNIILLHAHDETDEMIPQYYKKFLDAAIKNGLTFEKPEFFDAAP